MRALVHALLAALGSLASFGALADKGSSSGPSNGLGNGRGGSRFADAPGQGPASAFERAQLFKVGGLEFKATGGAPAPSTRVDSAPPSAPEHPRGSHQKPLNDAKSLEQDAASGAIAKLVVAEKEEDVTAFFVPWKVTDKDGKAVKKEPGPECRTK